MKRIATPIAFFLLALNLMNAQVGIGTTSPQADLHVAGDILVQEKLKLNTLNTVTPTDEDFKLITRTTNSSPVGEVGVLDVDVVNVAPVNIVNYHFTNVHLDNLSDVNLQYDTSKYIVGIANFRYVGDAIEKTYSGTISSIGNFVARTFESGGTWHLEIQNRILDVDLTDTVEYNVTLIVYDKSYFRNLPTITTDLGGLNNGTASSVPVFN